MTGPWPPYHLRPYREPCESDDAAIDRFEDGLNSPDPDDAPRSWEP